LTLRIRISIRNINLNIHSNWTRSRPLSSSQKLIFFFNNCINFFLLKLLFRNSTENRKRKRERATLLSNKVIYICIYICHLLNFKSTISLEFFFLFFIPFTFYISISFSFSISISISFFSSFVFQTLLS